MNENVFFDDWRECLREHYLHVLRTQDTITEPSLRGVLLENDFSLAEIEELWAIFDQPAPFAAPEEVYAEAAEVELNEPLVVEEAIAEPPLLEEPLMQEAEPEPLPAPLDLFSFAPAAEEEAESPLPKPKKTSKKKEAPPTNDQLSLF